MRSCQALHFWKFGRRFNSPSRKREVHTMSPLYKYSQADILNLHWTVSHLNICYEFPYFLRPLPWVVQSHKRKLTLQCAFIQPITFTQIANHICFFFFFFFSCSIRFHLTTLSFFLVTYYSLCTFSWLIIFFFQCLIHWNSISSSQGVVNDKIYFHKWLYNLNLNVYSI